MTDEKTFSGRNMPEGKGIRGKNNNEEGIGERKPARPVERRMIIAVDFDGTLCENAYPRIGKANASVIEGVLRAQAAGARLILWTCRSGDELDAAVTWCREHGIEFDAVNASLPEQIEAYGEDTRKVFADIYLDDRAMRPAECMFLL